MSGGRTLLFLVLLIIGVYFLIFHTDPLPLNHEAVGLGEVHVVHDILGVILLAGAGVLWYTSKRGTAPRPT